MRGENSERAAGDKKQKLFCFVGERGREIKINQSHPDLLTDFLSHFDWRRGREGEREGEDSSHFAFCCR